MRLTAVAALISDLPEWELTAWVDRGWVHPEQNELHSSNVFRQIFFDPHRI